MIPTTLKEYLLAHEGCKFDICLGGDRTQWGTSCYTSNQFDPRINLCQLKDTELIFEADYKDRQTNNKLLANLQNKLNDLGVWYMRTSHKGKSDYVWVVLTTNDSRIITEPERKAVIKYFETDDLMFDRNLAYLNFVRPIPGASHWKHHRPEKVVEIHEGQPLNIDKLNLVVEVKKPKNPQQPYGLAKMINIELMAQRYNLTSCPACGTPFKFNVMFGKYSCPYCKTNGNIRYFVRMITEALQ